MVDCIGLSASAPHDPMVANLAESSQSSRFGASYVDALWVVQKSRSEELHSLCGLITHPVLIASITT